MASPNSISRLDFLRSSGLLAAGATLIPGFAFSGIAAYKIVIPAKPTAEEEYAAQQLLAQLLAIEPGITVVRENEFAVGSSGIFLGKTDLAIKQKVTFEKIAGDGYVYKPVGTNLIIAGGADKGLLFGVYDLLEELGLRRYAPDAVYVPESAKKGLKLPAARTFTPVITYRTTSYGSMGSQEFMDWNKLSSRGVWGLFVHTFETLIPPKDYGEAHPEYFSLIKGVRQPETQLCLSNPEVVKVLVENLKKRIAERPTARYWSVSQNDNDQHCQCEGCKALNEKYGGVPSGSIIHFVNQVARAIPGKTISTLAYWYSRKAPKGLKLEPNVNIMLCNIESLRHAPVYETDPAFSNDLKDWGALTNDILIWDYNIQFTNFFAPFPNLYTLKPNVRFYTENHVNALFMQANNEPAAEMALLRAYLISQLMWRPDADDKAIIKDFLTGYYGPAAPFIQQYIDEMHTALVNSKMKLNIFGDPIDAKEAFLSAEMMEKYVKLFDQAEEAVKQDPELRRRVEVARLPIMYAAIQIGRTEVDTPRSMFAKSTGAVPLARPEMQNLVKRFVDICKRENVRLIRERAGSPDHFQAAFARIFENMAANTQNKAYAKKIRSITQPAAKSKGVQALTDGIFASYESWQQADQNWVYYTGEHMDFVLDLGEETSVYSVAMDFLNPQAQPNWHLTALPSHVTYALSTDGERFDAAVKIDNPHNPNPIENKDISKVSFQQFKGDFGGQKARYVKVHAESLLKTPAWHIRSGQPLSIYTDQIVVR